MTEEEMPLTDAAAGVFAGAFDVRAGVEDVATPSFAAAGVVAATEATTAAPAAVAASPVVAAAIGVTGCWADAGAGAVSVAAACAAILVVAGDAGTEATALAGWSRPVLAGVDAAAAATAVAVLVAMAAAAIASGAAVLLAGGVTGGESAPAKLTEGATGTATGAAVFVPAVVAMAAASDEAVVSVACFSVVLEAVDFELVGFVLTRPVVSVLALVSVAED